MQIIDIIRVIALLLGSAVVVTTVLPLLPSSAGWIRMWDFPRPQIFVVAVIALPLLFIAARDLNAEHFRWLGPLVLGCALLQGYRIASYSPLTARQVADAQSPLNSKRCVSLLSSNVLQNNRDAHKLKRLLDEHDPDLVLLLETDDWWVKQLKPVFDRYAHTVLDPRDNLYGLVFLSKYPAETQLRTIIERDVPSVKSRIALPDGNRITFYGLHPRPPTPQQSSLRRDGELLKVANELRDRDEPAIVAGDMNDVAWSHTTRLFRRVSRMLDPRIGRGLHASFHADYPLLRWPIDHLFVSKHFTLASFEVLPHIGSDHFPIYASLCLGTDAEQQNGSPAETANGDLQEAKNTVRNALEDSDHNR